MKLTTNQRKVRAQFDPSRPIRIPNAYTSGVLRKKLIAPFEKRQPSHERTQAPERNKEFLAQNKATLYELIKISLQDKNYKRISSTIKEREVEMKQGRFPSECKVAKRKEETKNSGATKAKQHEKDARRRFMSRKDYLNISKRRAHELPREADKGSRLRERLQQYLYAPAIPTSVTIQCYPSVEKTGVRRKELKQACADANRIPQV